MITFCRFLYKDITDIEENDDFQDISLLNRLRVYMRDLYKDNDVIEAIVAPFTWQEIEMVCERLRKEANQNCKYNSSKKNNEGWKLSKKHKAIHIQNFLVIAFFCVMPPDRQRTFRQLTFGETLKYGFRDIERNTFISYDKLEKGQKPKYYIHLLPPQYKTGDTYGTYWHEIKNFQYEDGKHFYDYLNQWFFEGYRDELVKGEKTNAVFIRKKSGISFAETNEKDSTAYFSRLVKSIFKTKTKFPLSPHALRSVYITYINNLGLSEEVRKAIAYMMHHDIKTADKTYNKQNSDEKARLGNEFIEKYMASPGLF